MTAVALIGGRWVIARFGGTNAAAHMATHALIGGLTVIKRRRYRQPVGGGVTRIAAVAG